MFSYFLAPMEGLTSCSFRTLAFSYGASLTFTEQARVESLARRNNSTLQRIELKDDTPTAIQLLGSKPQLFDKFLNTFEPSEGFKGFNLNLGCSSPSMIRIGQGCAMVRKISKTKDIVKVFRDHNYPISIKMRLGINLKDKENKIYLNLIEAVDADYFIVHSRYGMQTYKDKADFSVFEECVKTGKDIIANGDIINNEQVSFLKKIGVKGVMIGREAARNPSIFSVLEGKLKVDKEKILDEYFYLSRRFQEDPRYKENVLKYLKS